VQVNGQSWQLAVCRSGQWTANPATGMVGGDGHAGLIAKPGYTLPGANEGALIGRIGSNGAPFLVGAQGQLPRGQKGELQLCINDDLDGRYGASLRSCGSGLVRDRGNSVVSRPLAAPTRVRG
jgi:hypothetical protein